MNDADKMREAFEKAAIDYALIGKPLAFKEGFSKGFAEAWHAATAQQHAEYEQLKADAERHLFMLENDMTDIYSDFITYKLNPFSFDYVDLDALLDQARSK